MGQERFHIKAVDFLKLQKQQVLSHLCCFLLKVSSRYVQTRVHFIIICILILFGFSQSHGAYSCRNILENPYVASDFSASAFQVHSIAKNQAYSIWAAKQANRAKNAFISGKNPYTILFEMARARQVLEEDSKGKGKSKGMGQQRFSFGGRNMNAANVLDTWSTGLYSDYFASRDPNPRRQELFDLAQVRIKKEKLKAQSTFFGIHENVSQYAALNYITLERQRIGASSIFIKLYEHRPQPESYHFIRHTSVYNIPSIMDDVMARIHLLDSKELDEKTKLTHFLAAMYGYYNAMPFKRGSAAIGRSYFAGLYLAKFDVKLPALEDSLDVIAMIVTQDSYLERYLPLLTQSQTSQYQSNLSPQN